VLRTLITNAIRPLIDPDKWKARIDFQKDGQATLNAFSSHYDDIHEFLVEHGLLEPDSADDMDPDVDEI
jgi:hypothetical protein